MISKVIRAVAVPFAAVAIPAAVLAAPLPASATTSGSMCEVNGGQYCLNTANFSPYTPVTESGTQARTIDALPQTLHGTTYKLAFNGDSTMCVASDNTGTSVEIKACNGSNGVLWTDDGSGLWINQYASDQRGHFVYLTGQNKAGTQYILYPMVSGSGYLQKFTFK